MQRSSALTPLVPCPWSAAAALACESWTWRRTKWWVFTTIIWTGYSIFWCKVVWGLVCRHMEIMSYNKISQKVFFLNFFSMVDLNNLLYFYIISKRRQIKQVGFSGDDGIQMKSNEVYQEVFLHPAPRDPAHLFCLVCFFCFFVWRVPFSLTKSFRV